jgi:nucleoside-diphosphate-sugar epimerase
MRRCRKYQVKIFRPFNIYGIGQRDHFLIQIILNQAKSDRTEFMDSRPKRDFIYIDDIVDAYVKAINYSIKGVEVFNLGSGISTSIKEVTEIISKYINEDFKVVFSEERRKNEVLETVADIKKVRNSLNWKPLVSIEDGISLMINNI